ncbi:TdeIII family type II restriction endonuclease [Psychrobacter sp. Ps5]|uniref:TdeIII family type II restriction endonuclease n=1 Tax=Psychrobacter faecalis TaxID=180588 RepID=UPI003FD41FE4|nr:TdeIII family type II restriction endonuclease [Psychrobacter sp. Ps5]
MQTYIAIPYNPESRTDNNYKRWGNFYDRQDLLVGDELWQLVSGGQFSLNDMVDIFREVGAESKEDIEKALNTDHF